MDLTYVHVSQLAGVFWFRIDGSIPLGQPDTLKRFKDHLKVLKTPAELADRAWEALLDQGKVRVQTQHGTLRFEIEKRK